MASRTGVAETPNCAASWGAEYTVPGRSRPAISAARRACATWSRMLSRSGTAGSFSGRSAVMGALLLGVRGRA